MGSNDTNKNRLLGRILDAAWTQQPTLMKMLSVVAATLLILAYGAEAVRKLGAHSILIALLLGGGIVLVVGQFIAAKDPARSSGAPRWLKGLRFIVALVLGGASILTALVLNEAYLTDEDAKPVTGLLARLKPQKSCRPVDVKVVEASSFEALEQFQRTGAESSCDYLKELEGLRFLESIVLPEDAEIWASYVEIPAGVTITLRDRNLSVHAIEIRGDGRVVGWPDEEPQSAATEPGEDGLRGKDSGNLTLDVLGQGSGIWTVDLRGQQGGAGARGQTGQVGQPGKRGRKASTGAFDCRRGGGDGGRGGKGFKGGRGGNGGPGGDGGMLTLQQMETLEYVLGSNIRFEMKIAAGGKGGEGGPGGPGGPGGKGGSGKGHCGGGRSGPQGEQGDPGDPGSDGEEGKPPRRDPPPQEVAA